MPVIFVWKHPRKHRQAHDDRGNRHVLSLHRLHRHLSALEDVKNTDVEARTQRLNVSIVWIADSSPPGARGATEDPAMCLRVETDTRGSSKTLVRHTCKACLKVILELPHNEATVRESTAKDVSRADTSQFRDISRAMHVRPQMTLNAREVDLVLGLLTHNVHVHLSRFSSISGTDFVSLLDDAIESILDPTETVIARNTGTTITTNDTSSGAASSLSASQSGAATQSKAFVAYCSNNTELQNVFVPQPTQLLTVQTLVMAVDADGNEIGQRCDQSLDSPFDPCQGQSDSPPVSLQEQQVTSSDSLRGQSAMPRVSAQQIDSDDEETAFFAAESFVIDQEHDGRVWATLDEGCNAACHSASWAARAERYFDMFGFQSEYREGTGLGGNTVAAVGRRKFPFAFAFTAERGDIHHLSGTIESWELPGDGPFLFPIDAQAKLGLIKDMARSRIFIENKPGFYLRMYKDAKTGVMLINVADFDLLNDQALTHQLLRASKPMFALAATIPPPTCLTGGTSASGEHVDILRSLTRLPGNHTLRFTHVAIGLDVMDEYPGTDGLFRRYISERHCGRIRDFSLGDREDRQMLVKTLRRRFPEEVHQTNIVLIDCRAFRDPASSALRNHWGFHPTTLSMILNHHKFPGLLLLNESYVLPTKILKTRILIGFICSKTRHRSVACSYLMQVIHTALNYTVNTRTTAIASSGQHLCNRDTCPDCSHLSIAAVRLMESVRARLVASWSKAVGSAVSTSQHPKQSVTLTSMPAIPVTPAVG